MDQSNCLTTHPAQFGDGASREVSSYTMSTANAPPITDTVVNASLPLANATPSHAECIVLQFAEYIPWNNADNLVSHQTEDIFFTILTVFFTPVLFSIACPANIINMIVFYKHGLKERINVCLFALSLADEVYMITNFVWFSDQPYLRFTTKEKCGPVLEFLINNYLLFLHGFIWVTQVLSAIIAMERCFCVMYPLRSQNMLSISSIVFIIISVHIAILGLSYFEMLRYRVICVIDPLTGSRLRAFTSSEFYFRNKEVIEFIDVLILGLGLPGSVMIVITASTIITTVKLRQAALWRASTSSQSGVSERDIALTKMLVVNSVFFVICLIPFIVFRFIYLAIPEVNAGGRKHNFFFLTQEILVTISLINSTFNIAIYYTMGSRYRQTFWQLFRKSDMKKKDSKQH